MRAIVCGLLEPVWEWNTPREMLVLGGIKVLVRDSAPGAAWSFRRKDWKGGARLENRVEHSFGYDYKCSVSLARSHLRIGALDLASHEGWEHSTHGNDVIKAAQPLDREKWGI